MVLCDEAFAAPFPGSPRYSRPVTTVEADRVRPRHSRLSRVALIDVHVMTTDERTVGIGERQAGPGTVERSAS